MAPREISRTNLWKNRKAISWAIRFAIRKARRSGSRTPRVSRESMAPRSASPNNSERSFQIPERRAPASSKSLPLAIPCATNPSFSDRVNRVGSRPSMNREKALSTSPRVGPASAAYCWRRKW